MSDILRAKETEDVLSSIRRLVSAEPRQTLQKPEKSFVLGQPVQPAASGLQIKEPEEGKLVLGPALRVGSAESINPLLLGRKTPVAPAIVPEPRNVTAFPKMQPAVEPVAESATAFWSEEEIEDAPFIEIEDEPLHSAQVTTFPKNPEPQFEQVDEDFDELEDEPELEAEPELAEEFDEEADLEDEPEPRAHWSEQSLPDVGWIAEAGSEWDDEENQAFEMLKRQAAPAVDHPSIPHEWADEAEAEVRAVLQEPRLESGEVVSPVSPVSSVDPANMFHAPSLDEEALRDIVRQIIREELSGSLGEKITRNVRKLVRIEVNRALTHSTLE